jgi:hypothetical protein
MDARDIAREVDASQDLATELRELAGRRLGIAAAAGNDTESIVRMLGLAETIRRMESRRATLHFNGTRLIWVENGAHQSWHAVSGAPGHTDKEHQATRHLGPIPEGHYSARQDRLQRWENYSWSDRRRCIIRAFGIVKGSGTWPGCVMSWGKRRVWLDPLRGTRTHGRSDFSIHGGWVAGSAGCIDLTSDMPSFVDAFLKYGKDMDVVVRY